MENLTEVSAPKSALRGIKVTYADGSVISTSMAAHLTDAEMLNYFRVGAKFNLGYNSITGEEDNMQTVVKAEILPDEQPEPQGPILAHLLLLAQRAYYWTSHDPEGRGERTVRDYSNELSADIQTIKDAAAKNSEIDSDKINATLERYKSKYEQHLSAYLSSHSNVASSFITGGSNFPVRRQEKLHRWADNKYEFFREFRNRALAAIIKSFKTPVNQLEAYKKDLEQRLKSQEQYKAINKAIRTYKKNEVALIEALQELGISESKARILMTPDFANRIGIPSFMMTNNLANIKRIQGRIAQIEALAALPVSDKDINGATITDNTELNRVQIKFPNKPSDDCRTELKGAGFRWAPSNGTWQAFRNQRNYSKGCEIIRKYYPN